MDFNYLCIQPSLKFPQSLLWKYLEKGVPTHLKLYGVVMAQYGNDDKLLVQTFQKVLLSGLIVVYQNRYVKNLIMGGLGSTFYKTI